MTHDDLGIPLPTLSARLDEALASAAAAPLHITEGGRSAYVLLSTADYDELVRRAGRSEVSPKAAAEFTRIGRLQQSSIPDGVNLMRGAADEDLQDARTRSFRKENDEG